MDQLQKSVRDFLALENHITDGSSQLFHLVVSAMHDLCFQILEAEKQGISREKIDEIIKPARDIHSRSVFVKRLQEWPRDYPGDFETIEYLCSLENHTPYGKIEYYIEEYALNSAMAQQHRNKIQRQAEIILDKLLNGKINQEVLSVGCGGSRDILKIKKLLKDIPFNLVLYDIDNDALELSKERLKGLQANIELISGNFLQSLRHIEKSGPFDLILSGGLFDYISDKHISFFLKRAMHKLLKPDSVLFFTNIKKDSPYKVWQEYLADWKLVYRCEEDIRTLLAAADIPDDAIRIEMDETGLTFLVTVKRQQPQIMEVELP